jgi:ParB-like chromosome segregation protein Spo0J
VPCRLAGLAEVPVIVKDVNDRESGDGLVENVQRRPELHELATVYARFVDEFGYTHEGLQKR